MRNSLKKILTLIFITSGLLFAQDSTWHVGGEMKYPVSGARAVVKDSLIYILGGYSDSLQANVNWIQRFNPVTKSWTIVARMIERRYGFFAGIYEDKLYIYGGINEVNENAFILEEWDFESSSTTKTSTDELFDRVFPTGAIFEDKLLMVGGYSASRGASAELPYITTYNLISDVFSTVDDTSYQSNELPIQQLSVKIDDKLYLFGGAFNGVLQDFDIINLSTLEQTGFQDRSISPRAAGTAVYSSYSGLIYLIGGYNEVSPAIASVETILDFNTYPVVTPGNPLNYARRNLNAVELNNIIYVFGGENAAGEVIRFIEEMKVGPTSVANDDELNKEFILYQNYPNPFNPQTNITFTLNTSSEVTIEVFNTLGEKVNEIFNGYSYAGTHTVEWDGNNALGQAAPTGIYFYRLSTKGNYITKKMLLLK